MSQVEAELAIERLLDHLEAWLIQQPEVLLLWTQDRQTRHRVAGLIAKELTTIPVREAPVGVPPRPMRRAIVRELNKNKKWYEEAEDWLL